MPPPDAMGILLFEIGGCWFYVAFGMSGLAIEFPLAVHLSGLLLIFGHNYPIKAV